MTETISRCMCMDDWIFEIKMVRALKVERYGKPYKAIAQMNINGDFAYLDGSLHSTEAKFTESDIETFKRMCHALGIKELRLGNEPHLVTEAFDRDKESNRLEVADLKIA